MYELYLPIDIVYKTAIEFSKDLKRIDLSKYKGKEIKINFTNFMKNTGRIEPFASLFLINSINTFVKSAKKVGAIPIRVFSSLDKTKNTYAMNLRFYSSLGIPIGQKPDENYTGSSRGKFIPIMRMEAQEVFKSPDEHREIKYIAKDIATVASRGNKELFECIDYSITEIIRNVLEHSGSSTVWYSAQYWPSKNGGELVEIALMDEGMGIQDSLQGELNDEDNILKFALLPGCSSKPTTHYIDAHADNSGFGLYMTSEIGKKNGDFIVCSNNETLAISSEREIMEECLISGTVLRLRLRINSIKCFDTERKELVSKGMELTDAYLGYRERKKFAPGLPLPDLFK
ncbi:hypothetical protein [Sporosarcina sp. P17b]|uniref:hypothetical protein n=1 Tax=Sporosarcina sp. P17b TaxID=2048260 RepID=UPI000C16D208|nr:hypothetical protein [Sporosarcina sp. P17b]PIC73328.1 hypothetical protein CSV76_10955 [Sporosarcina sp. P17b]